MAKWHGIVGYIKPVRTSPGVYTNDLIERNYYGDIIRNSRGWSTPSEGTNDNLTLNNQISILADSFATDNSGFMKYVEIKGVKWKITNIEIQHPRLLLTIGGLFNE